MGATRKDAALRSRAVLLFRRPGVREPGSLDAEAVRAQIEPRDLSPSQFGAAVRALTVLTAKGMDEGRLFRAIKELATEETQ